MSDRNRLPVLQDDPAGAGPGPSTSRRDFLRTAAAGAVIAAVSGCKPDAVVEELQRRHLTELTGDQLQAMLSKLEKKWSAQFGKKVTVSAPGPMPGVSFGYGLDLSRCIGCRRCVYACVKENNQSRKNPQIQWIRVLQMEKEYGVALNHANPYYDPEKVPEEGHFYMPVQCQQCRHPPCTKVCPVKATWKEADGIVVIDYDWCIGCRCCTAACPYGARKFNWAEPNLPAAEMNPVTDYLGNRPRPMGVVEKCTFCLQRSREGRYPACVEICPVGARKFGNLLDPESEIRQVMDRKRVFVFKEELATEPQFYYFYAT